MAEPTRSRRPNIVGLVVIGIALLAIVAVLAGRSSGGDDDDDTSAAATTETRDVAVTGDALPQLDDPANDPAVGQPAPTLKGETFAGDDITIPGDGPAVVMFLAHWCPHCRREVPFLVKYFNEKGMPDDVDLFAVATAIDPAAENYPPSKWLDGESWTIPTLVDSDDDAAAKAYGLSAYPFFVALDADGNVVARASGELEAPQLEMLLDAARGG